MNNPETIEDLLVFAKGHIHSDHAKILLGEIINKNPLELLNYLHDPIEEEEKERFKKAVIALEEGKPLQYVLGSVNFHGINYYIDERVLIPRFETEELVENTINYIKEFFHNSVDIIDLGCGSGVIGLTLEKKVPVNSVDLVDISDQALEVTKINKERLSSKANLIKNDMLQNINKKYDVIISNPPYIKTDEEIEQIVKENEPHIALYGGKDGLDIYRKIFKDINNNTKERCLIALEIGMTQSEELKKIIEESIPDATISIKKDMSDKDRMIFIFKNLNKN